MAVKGVKKAGGAGGGSGGGRRLSGCSVRSKDGKPTGRGILPRNRLSPQDRTWYDPGGHVRKDVLMRAARFYRTRPLEWVKDVMDREKLGRHSARPVRTETGLTEQQEEGLRELGKLIKAKLKAHLGREMSDEEREYSRKIGISIMSGQGTGKDFFAALVGLYFLHVFPNPRVLGTANTGKQLRNVLWSEIAKVMSMAKPLDPGNPGGPTILEDFLEWQSERVFAREKGGKRWFWEAVTVKAGGNEEDQASAMAGRHEDFQLFVFDEAAGIPDAVFRPVEGTLTGIVNIALLIFNPIRSVGFAMETHRSDDRFIRLRWNAEESELVSRSHIETMEKKFGRDSNPFRIRVLGLPPLADDDTLIPWDWIQAAVNRDLEMVGGGGDDGGRMPVVYGVDFGAGGDKTVVVRKEGGRITLWRVNTRDSNELIDRVKSYFLSGEGDVLFGDVIGIGWGLMGTLRKELGGRRVRSIDSRERARNERQFANRRAEMYWNLRTAFETRSISIPDDQELINQLGAIKTTVDGDSRGRVQIIRKKEIKKVLGGSPDEADALAFAYADPAFEESFVRDRRRVGVGFGDEDVWGRDRRRRPDMLAGAWSDGDGWSRGNWASI